MQKIIDQLRRILPPYLHLVFLDACVVILSLWAAWTIRAVTAKLEIAPLFWFSLLSVSMYCVCNTWLRLYQRIWEYATPAELVSIALSSLSATFVMAVVDLLWPDYRPIPLSVVVVAGLFSFIGFVAARYRERMWTGLQWRLHSYRARRSLSRSRVLIVGAGMAGETLARRFLYTSDSTRYQLVGFVDDNPANHNLRLHGLPIFGGVRLIPELVAQHHVDLVIIAIYNISDSNFQAILSICEKTPAAIKALPDLMDFLDKKGAVSSVRNISAKDLLGREPVEIDESACRGLLRGRRVLVTGAAGSIGSELCQQILRYEPKQLLMLDNNESGLYEMHNNLKRQQKEAAAGQNTLGIPMGEALVPIVSSVTNRSKMNRVFSKYKPEIVFHAAAYKHVPMMEDQPDEALWVNVYGTKNLVELSREYHTERFVLVSTDKAVQPVCIMGATKWLAELMIMNPSAWSRRERGTESLERRRKDRNGNGHHNGDENGASNSTLFTAVRFGNVLASRGSVVPAFEQQIAGGGPVMVTHAEMTRYFMSIKEAVSLIIQAATFTQGKDIFMLHMGERIKIDDLARRLIRLRGSRPDVDIPIVYTGIRPGEKLHEVLVGPMEAQTDTQHPRIFRIRKNAAADPEILAQRIDELQKLAKDHHNTELAEHLQEFVASQEGMQPDGNIISFKGTVSEFIADARLAEAQREWDRAIDCYNEALRLSEEMHSRKIDLICWIGNIHRAKGDLQRATEVLNEAKEASQNSGYIPGLLLATTTLGKVAEDSGEYFLALKTYRSVLRLCELHNTEENKVSVLESLGNVYQTLGKLNEASVACKKALVLIKKESDPGRFARTSARLGSCLSRLGHYSHAERHLQRALLSAENAGDRNLKAEILLELSRICLIRKQRQDAKDFVVRALETLLENGDRLHLAQAYLVLATIQREELRLGPAEEYLQKVIALCAEMDAPGLKGEAYVQMALWFLDQDQEENALPFLSKALKQYKQLVAPKDYVDKRVKMAELEMLFLRVARKLGSLSQKTRDHDHGIRVALHCLELADRVEMAPDQKKALLAAAFLHDIGESRVNHEILNKKGPLTDQEREQVQEHVIYSAKTIQDIEFPWSEVLAYVKYHHERYDGTGYPLGLSGEEIHLGARILGICDFYVALTTDRPHRKAIPVQEALNMIREESGKMFDPKFATIFLNSSFYDHLLSMTGNLQNQVDLLDLWPRIQIKSNKVDLKFTNQRSEALAKRKNATFDL